MGRPLILITNDDGIFAGGIKALVEVAVEFGDVVVVAPDSPQSGMGHAVTINNIITMKEERFPVQNVKAYSTSGTPVDCVKMSIYQILKGKKPDLLLSGINHGANSSINVIYSGTMSAAVEGALEDIPSIGFSLLSHDSQADFSDCQPFVRDIIDQSLKMGIPNGTCLNVNIPYVKKSEIKGIKICRQGKGYWEDSFEKRVAPFGKEYYWITGQFTQMDKGEDTDTWALENNYISIVPTQFDLTAHHTISSLNEWDLK